MQGLQQEFAARGPWITGFRCAGEVLGGSYVASDDRRLATFLTEFPRPGRVLELGCLEGGHSFPIAAAADELIAIDARAENLRKARWLNEVLFRQANVRFLQADLEKFEFADLGSFDVVFNVGLLYHLAAPWRLLARLAPSTQAMFVWTHFAADGALELAGGYRGSWYAEHGRADPLSGMKRQSFWPTLSELERMLGDAGFAEVQVHEIETDHPHGPAVLLSCRSSHGWSGGDDERAARLRRRPLAICGGFLKKFWSGITAASDNHVGKTPAH